MDYHTLPRRQLQALCKKHGIPANTANSDMADALTACLKPKPQLHADNSSTEPAKRATRGREPAIGETVSKSKDVEEESNTKPQEPTNSRKILEVELNRKLQRVTRGRGTACAVLEAPRSAAFKTEKVLASGETERRSATKQHETKKVSTRNGARKQTNIKMPPNAQENVNLKVVSPKSDKKKEKPGGIVLRRGKVKVRSPGNLSKSPESERIKGVTEEVGAQSNQSCLVDAKKTRKKKRSVTFSDVLEIKSACLEHPSRDMEEPSKEIIAEFLLGTDSNLPKNTNSACIAKRVVGTRRGSRSVSSKDCVQDVIAAQADHQKSSKQPVAKASKTEGLHASDAEKAADIEFGGQSNRKKSVRGKKIANSVGDAAAKENEEEKVEDSFIKGELIEDVPCIRRSRRLTIVPTDLKYNQDMQLGTEELKGGQSKDHHEGSSISAKKTEGALPADISHKSRRKTLAPLELNHVQSNVLIASEQKEKTKPKYSQSKAFASELTDEALESKQKCSPCDSTPVATQAEGPPIKKKEALSVRNMRGSRQKALVATKEVSNEMCYQNNCTAEIISGKVEKNVHNIESEKADSQALLSSSIHANSKPHSLKEVSKDAKVEVEAVKTTTVIPRSTRKTTKVLTCPDNGTAVSQEKRTNIVKQEGSVFVDEQAVDDNIQDSEDLDVIDQAYIEEPQEILVLKNTNELRVEDPVNSTLSDKNINTHSDNLLSAFKIVTGGGEGQNQINSDDAHSVSCNAEFAYNTCPTATHHATCDSETANSSPLEENLEAADVECYEFTKEITNATSSDCVQQGHELTNEKDLDVLEQEGHGMDGLANIISLTEGINEKSRTDSPVSIMIQDNGSLDRNHHVKCNDLENIIDIHREEGIAAISPGVFVESTFQHQNSIYIDVGIHTISPGSIVESAFQQQNSIYIANAEQASCMPDLHDLTSDEDKIATLTSGGAADLVEEKPNQAVELNLGGEDAVDKEDMEIHGDLQEQLHDTNEEVLVKSVEDLSNTDDQLAQLPPRLPSCSAEPGFTSLRDSACKTKQRCPRSIFKSARKVMSSAPWEDRSVEENTAPPPNKEDGLDSWDHAKKDAEIWRLDSHEMSGDEVDSAASEEEESAAEIEETLSDTEVCNFNTEALISNTEGDYACSEDDTPSDIEEDTMSESEDDFSEMEGELLSGEEECYESEELETSEEELSESEDDAEDDFEEYEASPVSRAVANSEGFDSPRAIHGLENQQVATTAPSNSESFNALCTVHCLQDQQAATIAPSKLSHIDDGITQPEIVNHTNGCVLYVDLTDIDEKIGGQHEELQENVDVKMSYSDDTAVERVQSTTVSTCKEGDFLTSLSSLFATPASKVKEDVKCSLAPPSTGILESNISQQSGTLETELILLESGREEGVQLCLPSCELSLSSLFATSTSKVKEDVKCSQAPPSIGILESNILPESGQEEGVQLYSPCELSHQDVIAEIEQHTVDVVKHGSKVCESVGAVEKELEINGQMVELVEACVEYSLAGPAVVDYYTASPMLDNVQNSQLLEPDSKNVFISDNDNEKIHNSVSESPCLGLHELILEGNGAEMGIAEDALKVQEEPGNFNIIQDGIEEDEPANVEVKNDLENNEVSVGRALDVQHDSEDFSKQVDHREETTSELTEELMITAVACTTLTENDNSNERETATEQDRQILHFDSDFTVDDAPQKQDNENTLALDTAYKAIGTTDSVVSLGSAEELDTSCHLLEEGEPLLPLEYEQDLMPSDAYEQPKTKAIGEEPEVIHLESNVETLVDHCNTPKSSKDSEIVQVCDHQSLDKVAQTSHCVEIGSVHAQVEEVHEKPLDESQTSEASNEDKEAATELDLISKEQSMKQIDLTLLSVRKLRQMCQGHPMSAKKETENATPARKPWMSAATQQLQLPNTSMHTRDLPSGNKRSALQALSSNVKAAPSAAKQTPTAKVLQRPRNLMGTLDGNEGPGKHLVTPSPQAPTSSKRDFARSHHR